MGNVANAEFDVNRPLLEWAKLSHKERYIMAVGIYSNISVLKNGKPAYIPNPSNLDQSSSVYIGEIKGCVDGFVTLLVLNNVTESEQTIGDALFNCVEISGWTWEK